MTRTGTIIAVKKEKRFGFIRPTDGGEDHFFHAKSLDGIDFGEELLELLVKFEEDKSSTRGPRAAHVRPLD